MGALPKGVAVTWIRDVMGLDAYVDGVPVTSRRSINFLGIRWRDVAANEQIDHAHAEFAIYALAPPTGDASVTSVDGLVILDSPMSVQIDAPSLSWTAAGLLYAATDLRVDCEGTLRLGTSDASAIEIGGAGVPILNGATPSNPAHLATKAYVDGVVAAGVPNPLTTVSEIAPTGGALTLTADVTASGFVEATGGLYGATDRADRFVVRTTTGAGGSLSFGGPAYVLPAGSATLPPIGIADVGRRVLVVLDGSGSLVVSPDAGDTVDGVASVTLDTSTPWALFIVTTGSAWRTIRGGGSGGGSVDFASVAAALATGDDSADTLSIPVLSFQVAQGAGGLVELDVDGSAEISGSIVTVAGTTSVGITAPTVTVTGNTKTTIASTTEVEVNAGVLDLNATGAVTIDGTSLVVTPTSTMQIRTTSGNATFGTIDGTGTNYAGGSGNFWQTLTQIGRFDLGRTTTGEADIQIAHPAPVTPGSAAATSLGAHTLPANTSGTYTGRLSVRNGPTNHKAFDVSFEWNADGSVVTVHGLTVTDRGAAQGTIGTVAADVTVATTGASLIVTPSVANASGYRCALRGTYEINR